MENIKAFFPCDACLLSSFHVWTQSAEVQMGFRNDQPILAVFLETTYSTHFHRTAPSSYTFFMYTVMLSHEKAAGWLQNVNTQNVCDIQDALIEACNGNCIPTFKMDTRWTFKQVMKDFYRVEVENIKYI